MNEELINQIVQRILSDPSFQGLLQRASNQASDPIAKSEALVLLNYVSDFPRVLNAVMQRWGAHYTLSILPSDQVFMVKPELPAGMSWISAQDALAKSDWKKLILPTCSPNILAKAALGIRDNPISEMIGRGISKGSSIELVTEYLGFTSQTPAPYRDLYEGYILKLQSYGVVVSANLNTQEQSHHNVQKLLTLEQKPETNVKSVFYNDHNSKPEEIFFAKKFLGDKQAYGFPEASRVLVKAGTVISPLARDTLKLRRIELCIEKERVRE